MRSVRRKLPSMAIALAAVLLIASCGDSDDAESVNPQPTGALPTKADLLFVVRGPTYVADGRLAIETDVVEWFTDRPNRRAGAVRADDFVENWRSFGFIQDPPNAALSGTKSFVTVELTDPELNEEQISFAFKLLAGKLTAGDHGFLSVFLDTVQTNHSDIPGGDNPTLEQHKDNPTLEQHKDNPTLEQHKDNPTQ